MENEPKNYGVVFTRNNARIVHFDSIRDIPDLENIVVNPKLDHVQGIAPHYWKHEHGAIVPMTDDEKSARDEHIRIFGVDNDVTVIGNNQRQLEAKKKIEEEKEAKAREDSEKHKSVISLIQDKHSDSVRYIHGLSDALNEDIDDLQSDVSSLEIQNKSILKTLERIKTVGIIWGLCNIILLFLLKK